MLDYTLSPLKEVNLAQQVLQRRDIRDPMNTSCFAVNMTRVS